MDTSKDYYAILGVLPSIDQAALAAVYRTLMKKYHPDVFIGTKDEAEKISKRLNEAYSILGDPSKRAEYDRARKSQNTNAGDYASQSAGETSDGQPEDEGVEQDWQFVIRYHPAAETERQKLAKISHNLALMFQMVILATKQAANYKLVAHHLKAEFLIQYFGANAAIHEFVLAAISEGRKDVALEVNRAIKVLGTPANDFVFQFLDGVMRKCNWESPERRLANFKWAAGDQSSGCIFEAVMFIILVIVFFTALGMFLEQKTKITHVAAAPDKVQPAQSTPTRVSPSFDCAKVSSQVLKLICNTPALAEADQKLASAYKAALRNTRGPEALKSDERAWIRSRNNSTPDIESLLQIYSDRITFLNTFQNSGSSEVTVPPNAVVAIAPAATANSNQQKATADSAGPALGAALNPFNGGAPQVYGDQNFNPRVILRARGDTRVTVRNADGSFLLNRDLKAGDIYQVPDVVGVTMATSNAGEVEVVLDGIALGRAGAPSQILGRVSLDPQSLKEHFKPH